MGLLLFFDDRAIRQCSHPNPPSIPCTVGLKCLSRICSIWLLFRGGGPNRQKKVERKREKGREGRRTRKRVRIKREANAAPNKLGTVTWRHGTAPRRCLVGESREGKECGLVTQVLKYKMAILCKQVIRMNFLQQRSPQGTDGTNFEMSLRTVNKTFL